MSESELLQACRDLRLLTTFWYLLALGGAIVSITFGCMYHYGIRYRLPRLRATLKRVAGERDEARAQGAVDRTAAKERITQLADDLEIMRGKCETIGLEAQKEIEAADNRATRERAIRKKTEDALTLTKAKLEEEEDVSKSLREFLAAVHTVEATAPTEAVVSESWVDQAAIASAVAATK